MAQASSTSTAPDALAIIEEEARAVSQFFGIVACDLAAQMLVTRIAERLGGERHYVSGPRAQRRERDALIRARFTGDNLHELAVELGMTERHLRRILAVKPATPPSEK
jgi:Mor family transcriptional regulator